MASDIFKELKTHAPFTVVGALTGILIMVVLRAVSSQTAYNVFYVLHPMHVVLSALVTASMYQLHTCKKINSGCLRGKCNFLMLLLIGYVGSVGIATLSDSLIPYVGEVILNMPRKEVHIGFIEKWWLVNPLALLGISIAYFNPSTKYPHALHVLISTWASLFHMLMAVGQAVTWYTYAGMFVFLFLAVWIPCCVSDIVFPLLFVDKKPSSR